MRGPGAIALLALLPMLSAAASSEVTSGGSVEGRVTLAVPGTRTADLGPIVVSLEPLGADAAPAPGGARPVIRQRDARFTPGFLVVQAGQAIEMPNDDQIYHNVFSSSEGNRFDLGLYPSGASRSVTFERPGLVRVYCSIHESMNASVYVAPSRHFVRVDSAGAFALRRVPAGRYRLRVWSERLPETTRTIRVEAGRSRRVELALGAPDALSHPAAAASSTPP